MTLSAEETFIAKASGISATEYAKNKIRLQREKAAGDRQ
jgi:phage I-like protein